jgi:hypothetical protein
LFIEKILPSSPETKVYEAVLAVYVQPILGVVIVGEVPNTSDPVPVSSEITPASSEDVVAANCDNLPVVKATLVIAPVPPLTDETPVTAPVAPL